MSQTADPQAGDLVIEPFVAERLGDSAYLVGSRAAGEAVLIDPQRDIEPYLARAEALGLRVTSALETHIHNDFVSGAREVAHATGAHMGASASAELDYPFTPLRDGEDVTLGGWRLRVMATPGHTPEHISYLLTSDGGTPEALFSGGSLMVGSIARPDLLGPAHTAALTRAAWETLRERLLVLPDEVAVYPTHGGGSFCGAGQSWDRVTTIGHERDLNPLAQAQTYRQFVSRYLGPLGAYPAYYKHMRASARRGYPLLGRAIAPLKPLTPDQVEAALASGATLVDARPFPDYDTGHIPNSLAAGLDDALSAWVGWLLEPDAPIIVVAASDDAAREAQIELLRIGFDNLLGALEGGIAAWAASGRALRQTPALTMADIAAALEGGKPLEIVDAREPDEWARGHVPGATHAPLGQISRLADGFPRDVPIAIHCGHGFRSSVAVSVLERGGFESILHITDGYAEWRRAWE